MCVVCLFVRSSVSLIVFVAFSVDGPRVMIDRGCNCALYACVCSCLFVCVSVDSSVLCLYAIGCAVFKFAVYMTHERSYLSS